MKRTGSAILIFFIISKDSNFPKGQPPAMQWLAIFIYTLWFWKDITEKTTLIIIFLTKSIKDEVSRAVSGALSGGLKVALLRAMFI